MPVTLDSSESMSCSRASARARRTPKSSRGDESSSVELQIGLLNNMSDGALEATERQFISVLSSAAQQFSVRLSLYHFPEVPRGELTRGRLARLYHTVDDLLSTELDGLIVTGREPLSADLRDECYWDSFIQVHDWALENTRSTVWSCLAAHAAVLHADGIQRQRSQHKHSGVFDCLRASDHPMLKHVPEAFRLPHSRWNGLPEAELTQCGYQVLTFAEGAGVDCFVKQNSSLFVYFQGHPEYESETLLLEYRRDVIRYLNEESSVYPSIPRGYFNSATERELTRIQDQAKLRPHAETLAAVSALTSSANSMDDWSVAASTLYRNWLGHIHAERLARAKNAVAESSSYEPAILAEMPAPQYDAVEDAVA